MYQGNQYFVDYSQGCGSGSGNRKWKRWKRQILLEVEAEAARKSEAAIRSEAAKWKRLRNFEHQKGKFDMKMNICEGK